jgi:peptidoglycan-associated lipoprotein
MNKNIRVFSVVFVALCFFALWGCPKKTEVSSAEQAGQKETVTAPATPAPESGQQQVPASAGEPKEHAAGPAQGLKPVYFDFDKSFIRDDAREVLKENAAWLKAHPKVKIKIEGNCDEKGTSEYNQALGQRRAVSAKKYLADMGVSASRISLISYGKEKPVCTEGTENCWQKNRRDDFMVND